MYDEIIMKKVHIKDSEKIYRIILECAQWLKSRGIKQWNPPYPKELFKKDISEGKVYYFVSSGKIVGTATLSKNKPFYYPKNIWSSDADVLYLTKFSVPRKLKNLGIGKKLLVEIGKRAKTSKIKKIRLDVPDYNKKLINYYFESGFIPVKKASIKITPSVLMEKQV